MPVPIKENEKRKPKKRVAQVKKDTAVARVKPDHDKPAVPYDGPLVEVRVRVPIAGSLGMPVDRNRTVKLPEELAKKYLANGTVVPAYDIPLKEAIRIVKKAGGEVSCDKSNAAFIAACEELEADGMPEIPEPEFVDMSSRRDEIVAYAAKHGIKHDAEATKREILAHIEAAEAEAGAGE